MTFARLHAPAAFAAAGLKPKPPDPVGGELPPLGGLQASDRAFSPESP